MHEILFLFAFYLYFICILFLFYLYFICILLLFYLSYIYRPVFHFFFLFQSAVYSCLAKLARYPRFYDRLVFARGISTLVGETRARKYNMRHLNRRDRSAANDELRLQIEGLEGILKFDLYCIIIQAAVRGFFLRKARRRRRRNSQLTNKVGKH